MRRKRIVVLSAGCRGGGSETYLRGIMPHLIEKNPHIEYHLFIAESKRDLYDIPKDNLILHVVKDSILDSPFKRVIFDNITLFTELRAISPDVCLCTSEIFSPLMLFLRIPIINVYHAALQFYMMPGIDESRLRLWYIRFMRGVSIRIAKKTVAVSHFERGEIGGRYPKRMLNNIIVIYHGVDHDYFRLPSKEEKSLLSPLHYPYILCVSDKHRHKKVDEMIKIFDYMVKKNGIKEHLVIIGRSKSKSVDNELSLLIKGYGLENRVHLLDYVDNKEIRNYYWNANLYWTHSEVESFGLTPLEAMACGLAVLSSWRGALPEIYGDAACFYNPYFCNKSQIANMASMLLLNEEIRQTYIQRGLDHAGRFQWSKAANDYHFVLEEEMNRQ